MKKTRFSEEQMVTILCEADQRPVPEVAKKNGVSAQTLYAWRKHFGTTYRLDAKNSCNGPTTYSEGFSRWSSYFLPTLAAAGGKV